MNAQRLYSPRTLCEHPCSAVMPPRPAKACSAMRHNGRGGGAQGFPGPPRLLARPYPGAPPLPLEMHRPAWLHSAADHGLMSGREGLRLGVVQEGRILDRPNVDIPALTWRAEHYAHCCRALYALGEQKEGKVLFLGAPPIQHDEHTRGVTRDHSTGSGPEGVAFCAPYRREFVMPCKCCAVADQSAVPAYPVRCESCPYVLKHCRPPILRSELGRCLARVDASRLTHPATFRAHETIGCTHDRRVCTVHPWPRQ